MTLVSRIVESLLGGITSQTERGTEANVLISFVLEASSCENLGRMTIKGRCIRKMLVAISHGHSPTPTTLSNLLACFGMGEYARLLLAHPEEDAGLGFPDPAVVKFDDDERGKQAGNRHVSELLVLALELFSKAGGHIGGKDILASLLQEPNQHSGRVSAVANS